VFAAQTIIGAYTWRAARSSSERDGLNLGPWGTILIQLIWVFSAFLADRHPLPTVPLFLPIILGSGSTTCGSGSYSA
jgi:hypothetical protein